MEALKDIWEDAGVEEFQEFKRTQLGFFSNDSGDVVVDGGVIEVEDV